VVTKGITRGIVRLKWTAAVSVGGPRPTRPSATNAVKSGWTTAMESEAGTLTRGSGTTASVRRARPPNPVSGNK